MRRILLPALAAVGLLAAPATDRVARADDWEVKRNPFDKTVVARYKNILARNPHDGDALNRLTTLYKRHKSVDQLVGEYEKALEKKAGDWAILVVLGRLAKTSGDEAKALTRFEAAAKAKATDAAVWVEIGTLHRNAGKTAEARKALDSALANASAKPLKMKALRALADLALAGDDIEGAKKYFEQYIGLDPKNVQLRFELGDALLAANKHDQAIAAYRDAEKLLSSDPQRRMEVIGRIGLALDGKGEHDAAVTEYRRAIKMAPKGYYLQKELTTRIVEIYRNKNDLKTLLAQLEKEWPTGSRGHFEWDTLARLYSDVSEIEKAIAAFRKAVAKSPWELETQRALIQLLENAGKEAEAIKQYEEVVRVAPGEARFQLDLAERYWRRGDAKKALDSLRRLEGRFPGDAGILSAIADLYIRWNKEDLALAAFERLTRLEPNDPGHLVTLGEQYFQRGDKDKAIATWKKIANAKTAAAEARLGEVLNEHGMPADALAHFAKAIKMEPNNPDHYRGRAQVYEGQKQFGDAIADLEKVLSLVPATDRTKRRDTMRRLVQLVTRWSPKEAEYRAKWQRDFTKKQPPDIEAGYFLVEYFTRKPDTNQPRETLEKLHKLVPKDQDTILDLVKAYRAVRRYDEAVALLLELAKIAPGREREVFTQISEIKTEARQDKEAIEWAQKALAKTPKDAVAYEKLAERYVEMQRYSDAIENYEKAIKLDSKNWKNYFALAKLYVMSDPVKAAELYRRVLSQSTDDELIERAAKEAIDIQELDKTTKFGLGELEKRLQPLSTSMAHKPVFRRKLVDLYIRYVPRLVDYAAHGDPELRKQARAELDRLGSHGLRALLEALHDDKDPQQQRIAVKMLGYLGNKSAAAPLVQLARQEPKPEPGGRTKPPIGTLSQTLESEIRTDALIAAGRIGSPGVIDMVVPLASHAEGAMREAAVFTLGRTGDKKAIGPLVAALGDKLDSVQALACIGLAAIDDNKAVAAIAQTLADTRRDDRVRAACAYGLGVRRAKSAAAVLTAAVSDNHGETQRLAGWALGQLGDSHATSSLLRAYFARRGGDRAELAWAIARVTGATAGATALASPSEYPLRGGSGLQSSKLDLAARVAGLPGEVPAVNLPAGALAAHTDAIVAGLSEALAEHRDVVLGALADLDARKDGLTLAGLVGDGALDEKTRVALAKVGAGVADKIVPHLDATDPKIRAHAVSVLAKIDAKGVDARIVRAFADKTDMVRHAAMRAAVIVGTRRPQKARELTAALAKALAAPAWQDRRAAARALGELGGVELGALTKAAGDQWAYVREAVATALGASATTAAVDPLLKLSQDDVPHVRAAAARALSKVPGEAARKRRAELTKDPDPTVSAAAKQ